MKVCFNRKPVDGPFGGGNQVLRYLISDLKERGAQVVFALESGIDAIVLMDVRNESCRISNEDIRRYRAKNSKCRVVHRINENDAHRGGGNLDEQIINANRLVADHTVWVSAWLKDYFHEKYRFVAGRSAVIPNGADRSIFNPPENPRTIAAPLSIATHHWSDNRLKGYDTYYHVAKWCAQNPSKATMTLIGRVPMQYSWPTHTTIFGPKTSQELPGLLRKYDLYISDAYAEPGGNHMQEALSCGLVPLVGKSTGSCLEYANGNGYTFASKEEAVDTIRILAANPSMVETARRKVRDFAWSAEKMCAKYWEVFCGSTRP